MLGFTTLCVSLLLHNVFLVRCIQLARSLPVPRGDHSMKSRHNAYIEYKIRQNSANMLNHQDWHIRHVAPSPTVVTYISTLTVVPLPLKASIQSPLLSPSPPSSWVEPPASSSSIPPRRPQPPLAVQKLSKDSPESSLDMNAPLTWETEVAQACSKHLSALEGIASNPSGQTICYNIQSLDSHTGIFHADIRLYRLAPGQGDWVRLQASPLTIGLSYLAASVRLQNGQTRDRIVNTRSLPASTRQADRGRDFFVTPRSESPQFLQSLALLGQISGDSIKDLTNMSTAFELLRPKINLSGQNIDGFRVTTQLALTDASFVHGLFAGNDRLLLGLKTSVATQILSKTWPSKANQFASTPVGLILVAAWSLLLLAAMGWETWEKIIIRREDQRRLHMCMKDGWHVVDAKRPSDSVRPMDVLCPGLCRGTVDGASATSS